MLNLISLFYCVKTATKATNCTISFFQSLCQSSFHGWVDNILNFTLMLEPFLYRYRLNSTHIKYISDVIIRGSLPALPATHPMSPQGVFRSTERLSFPPPAASDDGPQEANLIWWWSSLSVTVYIFTFQVAFSHSTLHFQVEAPNVRLKLFPTT